MPAQTWSVAVQGGATEDITIPAGSYYLEDSTGAYSLCEAVATALDTHTDLSGSACYLGTDRQVYIEVDANCTIAFTDIIARNMLGFQTADTSVNDTVHIASLISRYLWVPDKPESPMDAILGVDGHEVKDTKIGISGLGG